MRERQDMLLLLNTVPGEGRICNYNLIQCQGRAGYIVTNKYGARKGQLKTFLSNKVPGEGRIHSY